MFANGKKKRKSNYLKSSYRFYLSYKYVWSLIIPRQSSLVKRDGMIELTISIVLTIHFLTKLTYGIA